MPNNFPLMRRMACNISSVSMWVNARKNLNLPKLLSVKIYQHKQTVEITNSNEVHHIPVDKRKCRFPHERLMGSDMPYSMSACFTELRIRIELEKCNCTMPTSPIECKCTVSVKFIIKNAGTRFLKYVSWNLDEKKFCDYAGMMCLQQCKFNSNALFSHFYINGKNKFWFRVRRHSSSDQRLALHWKHAMPTILSRNGSERYRVSRH